MSYKVDIIEDIKIQSINKRISTFIKSPFIQIQKNMKDISVGKEVNLLIKSPWFYWYTGEKKVALISWAISLFFPILIFAIAFFTANAPLLYLLQFILVVILDNLIWLVVGFLGILIVTLNSILPSWLPSVGTDTIENLITTLIIPLVVMGIYGFFQSRIITRLVAARLVS